MNNARENGTSEKRNVFLFMKALTDLLVELSLERGLLSRHCFSSKLISSHSFPLRLHDEPKECVHRRLLIGQTIHNKLTDVTCYLSMVNSLDNLPSNSRIYLNLF